MGCFILGLFFANGGCVSVKEAGNDCRNNANNKIIHEEFQGMMEGLFWIFSQKKGNEEHNQIYNWQ